MTVAVDTMESACSGIKIVHKDTMHSYVGVIIDQDEGILKKIGYNEIKVK